MKAASLLFFAGYSQSLDPVKPEIGAENRLKLGIAVW